MVLDNPVVQRRAARHVQQTRCYRHQPYNYMTALLPMSSGVRGNELYLKGHITGCVANPSLGLSDGLRGDGNEENQEQAGKDDPRKEHEGLVAVDSCLPLHDRFRWLESLAGDSREISPAACDIEPRTEECQWTGYPLAQECGSPAKLKSTKGLADFLL